MPYSPRILPALALALGVLFSAEQAIACSPTPGWRPPQPKEAFERAGLVVYGVVDSVRSDSNRRIASLKNVVILKGGLLPANEVATTSSAMCGIDDFVVNREYVFFLSGAGDTVSLWTQPQGSGARILESLKSAGLAP